MTQMAGALESVAEPGQQGTGRFAHLGRASFRPVVHMIASNPDGIVWEHTKQIGRLIGGSCPDFSNEGLERC